MHATAAPLVSKGAERRAAIQLYATAAHWKGAEQHRIPFILEQRAHGSAAASVAPIDGRLQHQRPG